MSYRLICIQLMLFSLTYASFLHITTPSSEILPWLHGVFSGAAIAAYLLAQRLRTQSHRLIRLLPWSLFATLWSSGTISITQYWSGYLAARQGVEAVLFYGTSGMQFFSLQDATFCWLLLIPTALISLVI